MTMIRSAWGSKGLLRWLVPASILLAVMSLGGEAFLSARARVAGGAAGRAPRSTPQGLPQQFEGILNIVWGDPGPLATVSDERFSLALPDGTAVFESAAILIHLTLAHPAANLAPPVGSPAHARFLQWMLFLSSNVYESALRCYYPERYSTSGQSAANEIKDQAVADYARHLEMIHDALSPYVLGEKVSAADPYLHMLASWYLGDLTALHARLPKLAQHAKLLRQRSATVKAEQAHTDG